MLHCSHNHFGNKIWAKVSPILKYTRDRISLTLLLKVMKQRSIDQVSQDLFPRSRDKPDYMWSLASSNLSESKPYLLNGAKTYPFLLTGWGKVDERSSERWYCTSPKHYLHILSLVTIVLCTTLIKVSLTISKVWCQFPW